MDVLSPFISVLCHSAWLFHGESCPRLHVVHPGRAWPSSPAYTWHCSLQYLFVQATALLPRGVTVVSGRGAVWPGGGEVELDGGGVSLSTAVEVERPAVSDGRQHAAAVGGHRAAADRRPVSRHEPAGLEPVHQRLRTMTLARLTRRSWSIATRNKLSNNVEYVVCRHVWASYRPGGGETICPPADGSSTRGRSTSVRGLVRSLQVDKLQAANVPIA